MKKSSINQKLDNPVEKCNIAVRTVHAKWDAIFYAKMKYATKQLKDIDEELCQSARRSKKHLQSALQTN